MSGKLIIPAFLGKTFRELETKEQKDVFAQQLRMWMSNDITEELVRHLKEELDAHERNDDKDTSFVTEFQFNFKEAYNRGERTALRSLLKQLGA